MRTFTDTWEKAQTMTNIKSATLESFYNEGFMSKIAENISDGLGDRSQYFKEGFISRIKEAMFKEAQVMASIDPEMARYRQYVKWWNKLPAAEKAKYPKANVPGDVPKNWTPQATTARARTARPALGTATTTTETEAAPAAGTAATGGTPGSYRISPEQAQMLADYLFSSGALTQTNGQATATSPAGTAAGAAAGQPPTTPPATVDAGSTVEPPAGPNPPTEPAPTVTGEAPAATPPRVQTTVSSAPRVRRRN
jgi:hypothetical protein